MKMIPVFLISTLFVYSAYASNGAKSEILSPLCGVSNKERTPIDEKGYIKVGGIKQWVTIKGDNCTNPVVLFLHGE